MGSLIYWLAWRRGGLLSPWGSLGRAADITLPIGIGKVPFVLMTLVSAHLACTGNRIVCTDCCALNYNPTLQQ